MLLKAFRDNKPYFSCFFLFILLASGTRLAFSESELFLFVNHHTHPFLDPFFKNWTHLGDGALYIFVIALLLFFSSTGNALTASVSYSVTSLTAQFLKRVVFEGTPRPQQYFNELGQQLRLIEGVDVHWVSSFPSGHTVTAFSIATLLSLLSGNKWVGILYFFLAFLVGYSRMYLAQHFFIDVYAGAIIGTLLTVVSYLLVNRLKFSEKNWWNKPLWF